MNKYIKWALIGIGLLIIFAINPIMSIITAIPVFIIVLILELLKSKSKFFKKRWEEIAQETREKSIIFKDKRDKTK